MGESSYNIKLINKVEENLRAGNTKKLTKKEERLLEKTNKQVRQLLVDEPNKQVRQLLK